jgi:hypothetical protein
VQYKTVPFLQPKASRKNRHGEVWADIFLQKKYLPIPPFPDFETMRQQVEKSEFSNKLSFETE